jgi:N-acetylmuramoyl-L-alanine amidase
MDGWRKNSRSIGRAGWRHCSRKRVGAFISLAQTTWAFRWPIAFAERRQADLFLSLHFNSSVAGEHEQAGLETYCLTPAGMPSSLTRGYGDDTSQPFPNNDYDEQNLQYAVRLHRALLAVNGGVDRGVRRARFLGVLRGQHCPAVLVESGYLSNPGEARRISDPAHRQKLAEAIAKALE